jgi:hypothetical protein
MSGASFQRHGGEVRACTDDDIPGADFPTLDKAVKDIRVGFGECFGGVGRVTAEDEESGVGGIGEGAGEEELAASGGVLGVGKVRVAKRCAAFQETVHNIIEEREIGHDCLPGRWRR